MHACAHPDLHIGLRTVLLGLVCFLHSSPILTPRTQALPTFHLHLRLLVLHVLRFLLVLAVVLVLAANLLLALSNFAMFPQSSLPTLLFANLGLAIVFFVCLLAAILAARLYLAVFQPPSLLLFFTLLPFQTQLFSPWLVSPLPTVVSLNCYTSCITNCFAIVPSVPTSTASVFSTFSLPTF